MSSGSQIKEPLRDPLTELDAVSSAPTLLVACDYDGTLAPIVDDPMRAFPKRETMVALKALASMSNTKVAIISGRSLRDLATLTGSPADVFLVGSHGSEFDPGFASSISQEQVNLLSSIRDDVEAQTRDIQGILVEQKPAGVAIHYRTVRDAEDVEKVVERILQGPASRDGVHVRTGKMVLELSVIDSDKGVALEALRHRFGASTAVYFGDDQTDEDAFQRLSGPDLAVKVGDGPTLAPFHVPDTHAVTRVLAALSEKRAAWLAGSQSDRIDEHGLLSDQRTVALINANARLTWMCLPRIDSPAMFAELVGGPSAGFFAIDAADGSEPKEQHYEGDTNIMRTCWENFELIDYLDCSGGRPLQRAGRSDLIRVLEGSGDVTITFAPRVDFGKMSTSLRRLDDGIEVMGTTDSVVLRAPQIEWALERCGPHESAVATVRLVPGEPLVLELRAGTRSLEPAAIPEDRRRRQTDHFWADWAHNLELPDVKTDLVRRSALVLKALCYGPTGGIAAAATTSLPEHIGGVRNWDYRYSWIRDAAMSAEALLALGSTTEAMRYLDWLLHIFDHTPNLGRLRPVYGVAGDELGIEAELADMSGYLGSRPVRVGNSAARQLQMDVFGPLMKLVDGLVRLDAPLSNEHWKLVEAVAQAVAERWQEPDHGIWEVRGPRRHFLHSKIMCWQALDCAVSVAQRLVGQERSDWVQLRDSIAQEIFDYGWKGHVDSFVAAYDGTDLDAAVLFVGLTGLLKPDDPRFRATVQTLERFLLEGPTVYRYRYDDGLPGVEGGFHICTSWLIDSLILIGEKERARELFDQLTQCVGHLDLMSEEYDPRTDTPLGNFPQAYTHLGVIFNAINLAKS